MAKKNKYGDPLKPSIGYNQDMPMYPQPTLPEIDLNALAEAFKYSSGRVKFGKHNSKYSLEEQEALRKYQQYPDKFLGINPEHGTTTYADMSDYMQLGPLRGMYDSSFTFIPEYSLPTLEVSGKISKPDPNTDPTGQNWKNWDKLTPEEKSKIKTGKFKNKYEAFRLESKAVENPGEWAKGGGEALSGFVTQPIKGALNTLQIPAALVTEGIQGLRGLDANVANAFDIWGDSQRMPSDVMSTGSDVLDFGMNLALDPLSWVAPPAATRNLMARAPKLASETLTTATKFGNPLANIPLYKINPFADNLITFGKSKIDDVFKGQKIPEFGNKRWSELSPEEKGIFMDNIQKKHPNLFKTQEQIEKEVNAEVTNTLRNWGVDINNKVDNTIPMPKFPDQTLGNIGGFEFGAGKKSIEDLIKSGVFKNQEELDKALGDMFDFGKGDLISDPNIGDFTFTGGAGKDWVDRAKILLESGSSPKLKSWNFNNDLRIKLLKSIDEAKEGGKLNLGNLKKIITSKGISDETAESFIKEVTENPTSVTSLYPFNKLQPLDRNALNIKMQADNIRREMMPQSFKQEYYQDRYNKLKNQNIPGSEKYLKKIEDQLKELQANPKVQKDALEYYLKETAFPFTGKDAYRNLPLNAFGGYIGKLGDDKKKYPDGGQLARFNVFTDTPIMQQVAKDQENKDFLTSMINSPLFGDRYKAMSGNPDLTDNDIKAYQNQLLGNLNSAETLWMNPQDPNAEGFNALGFYRPKADPETVKSIADLKSKYDIASDDPRLAELNKMIDESHTVNIPYGANYNPWVSLHEKSHSTTGGLNELNIKPEGIAKMPEWVTNLKYSDTPNHINYLQDPTEQKARVDVARKFMKDQGIYDPINEAFTKDHYDKMIKALKTAPDDVNPQLKEIFIDYTPENAIKLMNSFVQNNSKQNPMTNQTVQYAAYGGMIGGPGGNKKKKKSKDVGEQNTFSVEDISASPYSGKSYHAYPNSVPEDMFKRTMGDMMYDMFHKQPRVKTTFANGGPINPPIKTDDPADPRLHAYLDSANLYKAYQKQLELNPPMDEAHWKNLVGSDFNKTRNTGYYHPKSDLETSAFSRDDWYYGTGEWGKKDGMSGTPLGSEDDRALTKYYEDELSFKDPASVGFWSTPDVGHSSINPIGSYYGGHYNPVYKKPVQPYEYTGDMSDVLKNRYKVETIDSEFGTRRPEIKSPRLKDLMADAGDTDYSFEHRKEIAKSLGIDNYTGSTEQNKIMKDYFKGGAKKPSGSPIEVENVSTNVLVPRDIQHKAQVNTTPTTTPKIPTNYKVEDVIPNTELVPKKAYRGLDSYGNPVYDEQLTRERYYAMGGPTDPGKQGMMKARLAYAEMHGNPAAKRMVAGTDNPYDFGDGTIGTHYMASMDNYAVPQIQENSSGNLILNDYGPLSNEAMRFDSPEDANYFAENYKTIAPAFRAMGGFTQPQYEAEGGEVVDGGIPVAFNGGSITPNSMTSGKINGQTHEQGGVDMAGGKRVFSDRLKVDSNFLKDLDI